MADGSGSDATDSFGSNTLTQTGSPGTAAGKVGNARTFNGSTQWFSKSDNAGLSAGDVDFTIATWVKLNSTGTSQEFIAKDAQTAGNREYSLNFNGWRFRFYVFDTSNNFASIEATAFGASSTGTWYYLVAWHDATANTINLQINNGTVYSAAHSTGVKDGGASFFVGARLASVNPLNGAIDDTAFWKKVLTSDEKTALYNSGNGKPLSEFDQPINLTSPVLNNDGTVDSGTWDTQSNGSISRTTFLHLASDDSLIATLYTLDPDFSSYVTAGLTYYVVERASNDGGYDSAEDTQSADATIAGGGGVTATPTTAALTLTTFAPTVTASINQVVVPTTNNLVLTTFAPTVVNPQVVTPTTVLLTLTTFDPSVTSSAAQVFIPTTAALNLTTFVPVLKHKVIPTKKSVVTVKYAPVIRSTIVTPVTALTLTTYTPNVIATANQVVVPTTATLALTGHPPESVSPRTVTPTTASLILSSLVPTIDLSNSIVVTPDLTNLIITAFNAAIINPVTSTPTTTALVLTTYPPSSGNDQSAAFLYYLLT